MEWDQLNEVSDWNDLSEMMEDGGGGSTTAGAKKDGSEKSTAQLRNKRGDGADEKPQKHGSDLDNVPISGWSDMKQFDDDHDPDWFEEEEKRLASTYGGHFIKVKYTEQGRPGYFCELCLSEMNAKKSLEAHCEGMKHLKKKALWEKSNAEKQDNRSNDIRHGGWRNSPARNPSGRDRSPFRGSRDRSRSPDARGRDRAYVGPARRNGPPRDQCVVSTSSTSMYEKRGGFGRDRRDNPRGFHDGPNRHPEFGKYDGPPTGHKDRFDRRPPGDYDRRGPHDDYPRDRFGDPNDRFDGPRPGTSNISDGSWAARDTPLKDQTSSTEVTAIAPVVTLPVQLHGSVAGQLLTKLASCYIKSEEDADLAMSVVSALACSLREYNTKIGEKKIAELLSEVELKLNTLKALKVGLKLLNKNQTPGSSAAAAAAAVTPRPTYATSAPSASGAAAQYRSYGGPPHLTTTSRQDQGEARHNSFQSSASSHRSYDWP